MAGLAVLCALAGCDGDDDEPGAAGTPTRPSQQELCENPNAADAGDRRPSAEDPRTLVLRLRDLPGDARFTSQAGVERFTFEDAPITKPLERAGFLQVARGSFAIGLREPEQQPGEPPPPPDCIPRTGVESAALSFEDEDGADRAYELHERLAASTTGSGIGPVGARVKLTDSPADVGDEATLIDAPSDRGGTRNRTIVWREGRLIGMVKVEGLGGRADLALAARLAKRQAEYLAAAD